MNNHLIIKGTFKNYLINYSFVEKVSITNLTYVMTDLESIFEFSTDVIMDFCIFDNNVTRGYDQRKFSPKFTYIAVVYLSDMMRIYEFD